MFVFDWLDIPCCFPQVIRRRVLRILVVLAGGFVVFHVLFFLSGKTTGLVSKRWEHSLTCRVHTTSGHLGYVLWVLPIAYVNSLKLIHNILFRTGMYYIIVYTTWANGLSHIPDAVKYTPPVWQQIKSADVFKTNVHTSLPEFNLNLMAQIM